MNRKGFNLIHAILFFLLAGNLTGCSDSEKSLSPAEKMLKMISTGEWKINSATVDDTDITDQFADLSLIFYKVTYESKNTDDVVWPVNGTWKLVVDNSQIIRDDSVEMTIVELTEHKLTLQFQWEETYGAGRIRSVGGVYSFTFVK